MNTPHSDPALNRQTDKKPYYQVDSLVRGIRIIELLASRGGLSVTEVARELDLNRSASHRFLATLKDHGYVRQDAHGRYSLTLKLFGLGNMALNHLEIRSMVRSRMATFVETYKETVNFACLEEGQVMVIEMVKGLLPLKVDLPLGTRGPAHSSALGKAILAFSTEAVQTAYLQQSRWEVRTHRTIDTRVALLDELQRIRQQGHAVDDEEWAPGIRCIAVPIIDRHGTASFALSVAGPVQRMTEEVMQQMKRDLLAIAEELSASLV